MQMIPAVPHRTGSKAELRLFDRLRQAFAAQPELALTAYHSLNLTRHDYKRFGEIDFLIVGRPGIFALEIKGGGVSCHDGLWSYRNRYGQTTASPEGPFRQAESALQGLLARLRQTLPARSLSRFTIGYGVLFPDCDWSLSGSEWDPEMLADARSTRNLEGWLQGLFHYWRRREGRQRPPPDADDLAQLKGLLRPEVELAMPLYQQIHEAGQRAMTLTTDQMVMVDVVAANPRVLCSGGAGTGKTFMAMELAQRWTDLGLQVLLACRSPWLKRYLESHFTLPGLAVSTADAAAISARRQGLNRFDALIVDEAQDLLDLPTLDKLDAVINGGLQHGRWCFFDDINNQSGLIGRPQPAAMQRLLDCRPARVPLTSNCRNTRQILGWVQASLAADMGVRGTGDGPEVTVLQATTAQQSAKRLAGEIERIIDHGGLSPSELTLLSPQAYADSSAALLPTKLQARIIVLDEFSLRHFPPAGISFATIANFKGIENEAVIVIDLPRPNPDTVSNSAHYVGMSRGRSLLTAIVRVEPTPITASSGK